MAALHSMWNARLAAATRPGTNEKAAWKAIIWACRCIPPMNSKQWFPSVGTWLSLVEHSLGVRGVGSSNLPVPTILFPAKIQFLQPHEMKSILEGVGFRFLHAYSSLEKEPLTKDTRLMRLLFQRA